MNRSYIVSLRTIVFSVLLLSWMVSNAMDEAKIDSIKTVIKTAKADTVKINGLNILSSFLVFTNRDEALEYAEEALGLSEKLAKVNQAEGVKRMADSYVIIADIKGKVGQYDQAIDYYFKALKIYESTENKPGISRTLNNLGEVYRLLKDYDKALSFYFKSLKIDEELSRSSDSITVQKGKSGVASSLNNIGLVYVNQEKYSEAIDFYFKALEIDEELGKKEGIAIAYNNIGIVYYYINNIERAIEYFEMALQIDREIDNKVGIATRLGNLGELCAEAGNTQKAIEYLKNSLTVSQEIDDKFGLMLSSENLAQIFEDEGDFESAYEYYMLYSQYKDALFNEDKSKEIGKLEAKHEFETAEADKERLAQEAIVAAAAEKSRSDNLQYSGILIFLVFLFGALIGMGKVTIPIRLAEGLIFFTFLLFFEFTLVLLDPYIEALSSGAPAIKLGFNAVLAGLIFPLHSFFEERVKKRIVS